MAVTPYVVGQWVRGEQFYGRSGVLNDILNGNRNCLWLLGTRRIGKTSILKQLEHLTVTSPELGYFPVFWDFQGAEGPDDLHESFADSLLDAIDRLEVLGINLDEVEADDLLVSLSHLRRKLRSKNLSLLLLGDEVEELVTVNECEPRFLRRLRRALQSAENIRTVLASKLKLWDLAYEETSTSPFLHGFTPPLFVHVLSDRDARDLILQSQLPPGSRPKIPDETVEAIREQCSNHPYLLQLLGERLLELGDLELAIERIATDQMVSHFFAVDFEMLTETERNIIRTIGNRGEASSAELEEKLGIGSSSLRGSLQRLEQLGFIRQKVADSYSLANYFFRRWFSELPTAERARRSEASAHPTMKTRSDEKARPEAPIRVIGGRYELRQSLGKGATGEVFKSHDRLLDSTVAVKVLKAEYCADADALERLRREVLLARDLSHPNILKVYHLGDDGGLKYVTMQFIEGSDLADILAEQAPLTTERAISIAHRIASGLDAAHQKRVLHRDIKPSNILIGDDGEPRITDFGLARLVGGSDLTGEGIFLGTPAYASPEQVGGEELDERSDIYSFGVMLYEMVTGRRPFAGEVAIQVLMMHLNDSPSSPRDLRPEVSSELAEVVLKCLAKNRGARFQSAGELADVLATLRS